MTCASKPFEAYVKGFEAVTQPEVNVKFFFFLLVHYLKAPPMER